MDSNNIFIEKDCICTVLTLLLSLSHNQYNIDYREHLYCIMVFWVFFVVVETKSCYIT